ncbi:acetyltransferase [Mycobacterium asiaticum]|uniref:Acetyltransferase n=1 Tax=Mycobacterium asiaticum TaxID=1790 RepID=A0A1A3NSU9_MYCAS|nr:GNAT family N-acetyltransferase [Mycobacterium asiaticum]OBK23392.1 acetyltransferase [Mycobacterium asiaticum]
MTEVRSAVPEDAYDVARVHVRSWQSAYRGLIAQDYLDSLRPEDWTGRYRIGRTGIGEPSTLLAVNGSTICGLAITGLCRDDDLPNYGELFAFYVDPDYMGTGVGRLLMAAARQQLRRVVTAAALWVLDGNTRARRFYERDGWSLDGTRRTVAIGGAPADEVRYQLATV